MRTRCFAAQVTLTGVPTACIPSSFESGSDARGVPGVAMSTHLPVRTAVSGEALVNTCQGMLMSFAQESELNTDKNGNSQSHILSLL